MIATRVAEWMSSHDVQYWCVWQWPGSISLSKVLFHPLLYCCVYGGAHGLWLEKAILSHQLLVRLLTYLIFFPLLQHNPKFLMHFYHFRSQLLFFEICFPLPPSTFLLLSTVGANSNRQRAEFHNNDGGEEEGIFLSFFSFLTKEKPDSRAWQKTTRNDFVFVPLPLFSTPWSADQCTPWALHFWSTSFLFGDLHDLEWFRGTYPMWKGTSKWEWGTLFPRNLPPPSTPHLQTERCSNGTLHVSPLASSEKLLNSHVSPLFLSSLREAWTLTHVVLTVEMCSYVTLSKSLCHVFCYINSLFSCMVLTK